MIPWGSQFLILEEQELDYTYFLGSNFLCFLPDCSTRHKSSLECLGFFECFSRSGDEQRLFSLSIDRRYPRQVAVSSGMFAALANPGERGLTAPWQVSLVFLVLAANQQFAWTDGNVARESQHNTVIVNISVDTSCVESFRARKQIFQKFYTLCIFRKTIFLCQS